jgi:hypothetical protein
MQADTVTNFDFGDFFAYLFHHTGDLVPQRHGQGPYGRSARSIVYIGVANACRPNAYQNIAFVHFGHRDLLPLKGMINLDQADGFHAAVLLTCLSPLQGAPHQMPGTRR